jgi:hypothetical protein
VLTAAVEEEVTLRMDPVVATPVDDRESSVPEVSALAVRENGVCVVAVDQFQVCSKSHESMLLVVVAAVSLFRSPKPAKAPPLTEASNWNVVPLYRSFPAPTAETTSVVPLGSWIPPL